MFRVTGSLGNGDDFFADQRVHDGRFADVGNADAADRQGAVFEWRIRVKSRVDVDISLIFFVVIFLFIIVVLIEILFSLVCVDFVKPRSQIYASFYEILTNWK